MEYTKGEWFVADESYTGDLFVKTTKGKFIALVNKVDANLITAAPDMYEALQLVNQWRNDPEMFIEEIAPVIKKALAKAEGK